MCIINTLSVIHVIYIKWNKYDFILALGDIAKGFPFISKDFLYIYQYIYIFIYLFHLIFIHDEIVNPWNLHKRHSPYVSRFYMVIMETECKREEKYWLNGIPYILSISYILLYTYIITTMMKALITIWSWSIWTRLLLSGT